MTTDEYDVNSPYILIFFSPLVVYLSTEPHERWSSYVVLPQPIEYPAEELLNI